jgi:transposase
LRGTKTQPKRRYTLLVAVGIDKVIHYRIIKNSANGEIFLKFIKDLIKILSMDEQYYILLDNARIHHYKKFKRYIQHQCNIEVVYNVPYTPEANPIEQVFKELKQNLNDATVNNRNIVRKIETSLRMIKQCNLYSYFKCSSDFIKNEL